MKRKLVSRYIGPYKITEQKGKVAYKLQLPPKMSAIFDVFHVSQLKWCGIITMNKIPRGNERITYVRFIPPFSKNGTSCKSWDEIFYKGEGL